MPKFQDDGGRLWRIDLSAESIAAVKERTGLDLDGHKLPDGSTDEVIGALGTMIWVLCEEQAKVRGMQSEDFAKALGRDGFARALECVGKQLLKQARV